MKPAEALRMLARDGAPLGRFDEVDRFTDLPFPVPALISEPMDAEEGLAVWGAAHRLRGSTGLVPVLLGAEPMIDWFLGKGGSAERFGQPCDQGVPFQGRKGRSALARIRQRPALPPQPGPVLEVLADRLRERFSADVVDQLWSQMMTIRPVWAPRSDGLRPTSAFEHDGEPVRCVLLGCPPWEVPLFLGLGGWNGSPGPAEQAVLLRGWQQRHQATLLHVGRGTVDLWVERPAVRLDEVRPLLWEVLLYCCDAVFADDDAFAGVRQMLASPRWSFAWD